MTVMPTKLRYYPCIKHATKCMTVMPTKLGYYPCIKHAFKCMTVMLIKLRYYPCIKHATKCMTVMLIKLRYYPCIKHATKCMTVMPIKLGCRRPGMLLLNLARGSGLSTIYNYGVFSESCARGSVSASLHCVQSYEIFNEMIALAIKCYSVVCYASSDLIKLVNDYLCLFMIAVYPLLYYYCVFNCLYRARV